MELVKLGKKGQVTIPKGILRKLAIPDEAPLVVEAGVDGAIILRQAVVFPIEIYSDARVKEFTKTAKMTTQEEARMKELLKRRRPKKD
jgi:bifunctional DNA-binding transcriptional regulator/antitoxin component of YhaV-PrlF toxin-antitoxin module